jgi:peptidoglycan/xylan/chitin deacetylase (PgdA/CDA1 family)
MKHELLLKLLEPLATFASGLGKQKKLLIMIYHRVLDEPDFMRPDEVDKEAFTWQIELLAKHFNVLPLSEALERMQTDTLPPRAVSITFDDGYADNYINALPILKKFNLTATFFIASGFLDGGRMWNDTVIEAVRNFSGSELDLSEIGMGLFDVNDVAKKNKSANQIILQIKHLPFIERDKYTTYIASQSQNLPDELMISSEQLKKLHQSGMEIGGHTVNHPILTTLDLEIAKSEINENKVFLEKLLGQQLSLFAYPNGKPTNDFDSIHCELVKQIGYKAAVSTKWGVVGKKSDIWQLPRFLPWDKSSLIFMARIIYIYIRHTINSNKN